MMTSDTPGIESRELRLVGEHSPYALSDGLVDGVPCRLFRHAPRKLNALYRKAQSMGDAPLLVHERNTMSYREVFDEASKLCSRLRGHLSVRPGMRVAIAVADPLAWVSVFIAVTSAGAVAVLIGMDVVQRIQYCIDVSRCSLIITDAGQSTLQTLGPRRAGIVTLDELMLLQFPVPVPLAADETQPEQEALISFTSGTTGNPKGVIHTHLGLITGLMNMILGGLLSTSQAASQAITPHAAHRDANSAQPRAPAPGA